MNRVMGVDCRSERPGAGRIPFVLSLALLFVLSGTPDLEAAPELLIEPGLSVADGLWLVPIGLVDGGVGLEIDPAALRVQVDGGQLTDFELKPFAPVRGGEASAVAVVLGGLGTGFPAAAIPALESFIGEAGSGAVRGLYRSGEDFELLKAFDEAAPKSEELAEMLGRRGSVKLWDGILAALRNLSAGDLPERRVLLVIADGGENIESEHPQATCVDAAKQARIAVHVLVVPGNEAGEARLSDLARRSGGSVTVMNGTTNVRRSLAVVNLVRGLWIEAGDRQLPADVKVELDHGGPVTGTVQVAERLGLGKGRSRLWPALIVLVVVAGAAFLFWQHRRRAGVLVLKDNGGTRRVEIPRSGVTIGTNPDNTLVLEDRCVSRHHSVIRLRGKEMIITDLRSTNGTQVNGRPVRTATLGDGDQVLLGGAVQIVYYEDSGHGAK